MQAELALQLLGPAKAPLLLFCLHKLQEKNLTKLALWALRKRILLSFKAVQTMAVVMKQCLVRQSAVSTSLEFGLNHQWLNSQGQGVKAIEKTDVCILYKTSLPFSKVLN